MSDSTNVIHQPSTGAAYMAFVEKTIVSNVANSGSDIFIVPPGLRRGLSVGLKVTSGTGKVQYSMTARDAIKQIPGNAIWYDWSNGAVATNTANQFGPINAIRAFCVTGSQTLEIAGD